jgi:glycosyltransferase involved in cell wall biosynthesis
MNMPSFYQDDLFRALADKVDLRVVYDHALTPDRRQLGWAVESSGYQFRVLDSSRKLREAVYIAFSERDRVHVVNGIWAESAFAVAALVLGMAHARFAIYAEAPNDLISRSVPRRVLRSAFGGWVARRACGLLAVSHFAADYYEGLGFTARQLYPFGYFRKSPAAPAVNSSEDVLDIVFAGQLVHRKGIDVLIEAAGPVLKENPSVRLSLIGAGPDRERIAANLLVAGISDRVMLEGVFSSAQMHERLARADLLVLPSRWDGWGLVINEAFAAGIPVIASDRCGAADLICHGVNGYVFRSEDVSDLRSCLRAFLGAARKQMRAAAVQTSSTLRIPIVADYLVACLEHMSGHRPERPTAPWENVVADLRRDKRAATVATD